MVKAVEKAVERAALRSATAWGEGEGEERGARSMMGRGVGWEGRGLEWDFDRFGGILVVRMGQAS